MADRHKEAGRKGGLVTRDTQKDDFYQKIGKQGGKKGGKTTLARHGADFFREIGKKGAEAKKLAKLVDTSN